MEITALASCLETPINLHDEQVVDSIRDYVEFLRAMDIPYDTSEYYWQVGEISRVQGWIIHLSVIISQMQPLLRLLLPKLFRENIPFKIIKDRPTALMLLDGNLGYRNVGKMISIYPPDDLSAADLVKTLIILTGSFKGPDIPTDRHLGAIVYTRYGSFNPVILTSLKGDKVKHIYDIQGELLPDPYNIPFSLPPGVSWPFAEIASPAVSNPGRLLHSTYYPFVTLKNDVKGKVVKALYFKRFWHIQKCVIKQGCKNAFSDEAGRDIRDRLKWQYELHRELALQIPMPKVIDYFEESGNAYLVLEPIKGIPLQDLISKAFSERTWLDLPPKVRINLLDHLFKIFTIIQYLHGKGYIHRDLTPWNMLIDRRKRIFLIDMELAWSTRSNKPSPPFKLGTPGFMSQQQHRAETPTAKEDIYALGGLMIVFFTNLFPTRLPLESPVALKKTLLFFTGNQHMAALIAQCLEPEPLNRPELKTMQETLSQFRIELQKESMPFKGRVFFPEPNLQELKDTVQAGISGLVKTELLHQKDGWLSFVQKKEYLIGNDQIELSPYPGWHTGMAGPLWLLGYAKKLGFNIQVCEKTCDNSWNYLHSYITNSAVLNPGLFSGSAGIGLALSQGLSSGHLEKNTPTIRLLQQCFTHTSPLLSLAEGVAGQGIALLAAAPWMESQKEEQLGRSYLELILNAQRRDGSWKMEAASKRDRIRLNLSTGVSGIIWFLLAYSAKNPGSGQARDSAIKGLNWLIKTCKIKAARDWAVPKSKYSIVLLFTKAFELFKDPLYREIVTANLSPLNSRPVCSDFTLANGIAGMGEIYLEAAEALNTREWDQRIDWIVQVFLHCFQKSSDNSGLWMGNSPITTTADLFTGSSGILHFLMRYLYAEEIAHPLWPINKTYNSKYCAQSGEPKTCKRVGNNINH